IHVGAVHNPAHSEPGIQLRRNPDQRLQIHRRDPDYLDSIGRFFRWPAGWIKRYDSDLVTEFQEVVCELLDHACDAAADMREVVITHEHDLQASPPPCKSIISQGGSPEGSTSCVFRTAGSNRGILESE